MRHLGCLFLMVGWVGGGAVQVQAYAPSSSPPVQVDAVKVVGSEVGPVVLLTALNHEIQIFVDPTVAGSIQGALTGRKSPRPLSHDLMHTILQAYGATVVQLRISLKRQIFYGELVVAVDGQPQVFDCRSSDGIALAIHFSAPIFVEAGLLDEAGTKPPVGNSQTVL